MEETIQSAPTTEEESSIWAQLGYVNPLARLCEGLEALPEKTHIPADVKRVISRLQAAEKVEDLDDLSTEDLQRYRLVITRELPRYYQEVTTLIRNFSRVRAIVTDDDFI